MIDDVLIHLTVNGRERDVRVAPHHTLLEALRSDLGLTGTKECCLVGECGACTVMVDGRTVDSCLMLAIEADGTSVTTVEGLAVGGALSPLQRAFLETGAAQCGFCIPGQLMSAHALLQAVPHPTRPEVEEGLAGNLCRCAGYEQIMDAVLLAPTLEAEPSAVEPSAAQPSVVTAGTPNAGEAAVGRADAGEREIDPAAVPDAQVAPQ